MDNLYKELALLTDSETESALKVLLQGLTIREPEYGTLLNSPAEMREAITTAYGEEAAGIERAAEGRPDGQQKAVRLLLAEAAENDELRPRLEAWLKGGRPSLADPITVSLVLAGIVLVLSTKFKIGYEKENGKKKLKIDIGKEPTSDGLLQKFFGIFK